MQLIRYADGKGSAMTNLNARSMYVYRRNICYIAHDVPAVLLQSCCSPRIAELEMYASIALASKHSGV